MQGHNDGPSLSVLHSLVGGAGLKGNHCSYRIDQKEHLFLTVLMKLH